MKLLLLCLLFGVAVAQTTYEPIEDEQENTSNDTVVAVTDEAEAGPERAKRSYCKPGYWCTHGSIQYVFISTGRIWSHAQSHCVGLGGSLAAVHNSKTEYFLRSMARYRSAWIGLSDAQYNNIWLWSNSDRLVYHKFCSNEPNNHNGNEACTEINADRGKCWNDANCQIRFPYICQKK